MTCFVLQSSSNSKPLLGGTGWGAHMSNTLDQIPVDKTWSPTECSRKMKPEVHSSWGGPALRILTLFQTTKRHFPHPFSDLAQAEIFGHHYLD